MAPHPLATAAWAQLLQAYPGVPQGGRPWGEALIAAYNEPPRHYHNLHHVLSLLDLQDRLARGALLPADTLQDPALAWAAWYHDSVYIPGARDNEAASARRCQSEMEEMGLPQDLIATTLELIGATAGVGVGGIGLSPLAALFADLDRAILAAPRATYAAYARAVAREYILGGGIDPARYRRGRQAFLEDTLRHPALYGTPTLEAAWGPRARANIAWEREQEREPNQGQGRGLTPPAANRCAPRR